MAQYLLDVVKTTPVGHYPIGNRLADRIAPNKRNAMKNNTFEKSLSTIEGTLGYTFRDKSLIKQAFTRTSYCNEHPAEKLQSNEVLEFFGDGVLSVTIISFLLENRTERYRHGIRTELGEGDFSNIKSKLSDKTNLSRSIERLGLEKYLLLGEGDKKLGIEKEPSVMEDLFESIVGAVYIDSEKNMTAVAHVVSNILDMSVYEKDSKPMQSAKNSLQEYCADKSRRLPPPEYKTVKEEGPDHKKYYTRGVYIGGELVACGTGKNMKIADAKAAEAALEVLTANERGKNEPNPLPRAKLTVQKPVAAGTQKTTVPTTQKRTAPKGSKPDKKAASAKVTGKPKASKEAAEAKNTKAGSKAAPLTNKMKKAPHDKQSDAGKNIKASDNTASGTANAALKAYAAQKGILSPAYHDLGMTRTHSGVIEYRIECRFAGRSTTATAPSRPLAREKASLEMARILNIRI